MSYASLLIHLELGHPNTAPLNIAADLAERLSASVTGVAVCQPMLMIYSDGYFPADVIAQDRQRTDDEMQAAEAEFRATFDAHVKATAKGIDWRPIVATTLLSAVLANEARCADLVITGGSQTAPMLDQSRHLDIGDFVMRAGRPCLFVPATLAELALDHVLIGWKDTGATRRAVRDALPLLRLAGRVTVVEVAPEDDLANARMRLRDVACWLSRHGIEAAPLALPSTGDDAARLEAVMSEQSADLLVAGAYGHSRWHEWVLGGVTRDLLLRGNRPALISH